MSLWPLCFLAACSTQNYDVMRGGEAKSPASMLVRLHDVTFPLLVAAAEWCPFEQEATYGFFLKDQENPKAGGERTELGASVVYVHPRLPAASAGLVPGDHVMQVNATNVIGLGAEEVMLLVRRMTVARIQPLQLEVMRAGGHYRLTMWAIPACQFSVQLIENDQVNGVADGRQVGVTTGAMRFLRSDDELAWVLAHEIAHNVLSHAQNARLRAMLNAFIGATVGVSATAPPSVPQRSLEAQADYIGSYLMARTGYDLQAIKQVWRRMETVSSHQASSSPGVVVTHPTTAERLAAFEVTLKEIEEKRDRGELLQPVLENTQ
jgi:hypothetical protein